MISLKRTAAFGEHEAARLLDAEEDARRRCAENQGRAPWGCRWLLGFGAGRVTYKLLSNNAISYHLEGLCIFHVEP